jgi:hypothetical protein
MGVGVVTPPPPTAARPRDGGGGGTGWVQLTRARDDIDAHLLTGRLAQAGIETRAIVDRSAPGAWLHGGSNPWAPVNIYVRRLQLEDARLALAEISYEAPEASRDPETVPRRTPTVWWLAAIGITVVLTVVALGQVAGSQPVCRVLPVCQGAEPTP